VKPVVRPQVHTACAEIGHGSGTRAPGKNIELALFIMGDGFFHGALARKYSPEIARGGQPKLHIHIRQANIAIEE